MKRNSIKEKLNLQEWEKNIFSNGKSAKIKDDDMICLCHFESKFIRNNTLTSDAIPTLRLCKGNTLVDFEELLSRKSPSKKKRGSSGI